MARMRSKPRSKKKALMDFGAKEVAEIMKGIPGLHSGAADIIRSAIKGGMSAKDVIDKMQTFAAVRTSLEAMFNPGSVGASAAKDLLDRGQGKATERKELVHSMSKLKDEELDALLITTMNESEIDESKSEKD